MSDDDRVRWARALTTSGWLALGGYLLFVVAQFRRAMAVRSSSFPDGVWGQRAEIVAFVAYPSNAVVLAPAALAAVGAVLIVRAAHLPTVPWSSLLVRIVAGSCYMVIALAGFGVLDAFAQSPDLSGASYPLLQCLGGMLVALALIRVCLESERDAHR